MSLDMIRDDVCFNDHIWAGSICLAQTRYICSCFCYEWWSLSHEWTIIGMAVIRFNDLMAFVFRPQMFLVDWVWRNQGNFIILSLTSVSGKYSYTSIWLEKYDVRGWSANFLSILFCHVSDIQRMSLSATQLPNEIVVCGGHYIDIVVVT